MGFIPIFLALGGFIFLWALVNYQTLRSYKQKALMVKEEINAIQNKITTDVAQLESCCVPELEGLLKQINADVMEVGQEQKILSDLAIFNSNFEMAYREEANGLQEVIKKDLATDVDAFLKLRKIYQKNASDFNRLIAEKPTFFIARLFGLKKMQVMGL